MATVERQCFRCGRRGTRQYDRYMGGTGHVCRAAKACARRRRSRERAFTIRRPRKVKRG